MAAFNYNIAITGDCQNLGNGSATVSFSGGTPPYTVYWYPPINVTEILQYNFDPLNPTAPELTYSTVGNLSAGTYAFRVNDSTLPTNLEFDVNVPISSGNCVSILDVSGTTCNTNNGYVVLQDSSNYSQTIYNLYTFDGGLVQTLSTGLDQIVFQNLSAGTYYAEAIDYGGCTGISQTFIINTSSEMDFGFYPVDDTQCGSASGRIIITGQTGLPPFTYFWNNGQTGSTITGLTAGTYSVKVTDSTGCSKIKSQTIGQIQAVGLGSFITTNPPSCFGSDGVITMIITGGTGPYYYSASTGTIDVSYSQTFTLSGVPAGSYNFLVTDAALCKFSSGIDLASESSISDIIFTSTPSSCSNQSGSINAVIVGGISPFTYTLVYPDASTFEISSNSASYTFENLSGGTYTVIAADATNCFKTSEITILSNNSFTITGITTGTLCGSNNGTVIIQKSSGGTSPFDYYLDNTQTVLDTTASVVTFTNVSSGQHQIRVVDASGCTQTQQTFVNGSSQLLFNLYSTSCGSGSDGTITAFISDGVPPFTFNWSNNVVSNPQNISVSGLTAGTYSLSVVDSTGCAQTRSTTIDCTQSYVSYQTYIMGEETFQLISGTKRGLLQMLNQGFEDLTSGNTNCTLISANFIAQVQLQPANIVLDNNFYTTTSLTNGPSDNLWYSTVETLLNNLPGIAGVVIDPLTSEITIQSDRTDPSFANQEVIIELIIIYDTMCLS